MSILPPIGAVLEAGTASSVPPEMSRVLLPSADKFSLMDDKEQWLTTVFRQSGLTKVDPSDGAYDLGTYLFETTREYGIAAKMRLWHALPACLPSQRQQEVQTTSCILLLEFFDDFPGHIFYLFSEELYKSKTDETFISELLYRKALQIRTPGNSSGVFNVFYGPNLSLNACDFKSINALKGLKRLEFTVTEIQAKCAELTPTQNQLVQDPLVTILSPGLTESVPLLPKPPLLNDPDEKIFATICNTSHPLGGGGGGEEENENNNQLPSQPHHPYHQSNLFRKQQPQQQQQQQQQQEQCQQEYHPVHLMPLKDFISESCGINCVSSSHLNETLSQSAVTGTTIHLNPFQSSLDNENSILLPQINFDFQPIQPSILSTIHLNSPPKPQFVQKKQQPQEQQQQQQYTHTHTVLDDLLSEDQDRCEGTPFLSAIPTQIKKDSYGPIVKSELMSPTINTASSNSPSRLLESNQLKSPEVGMTTLVKVAPVINPNQPLAGNSVCPVLNLKRRRPGEYLFYEIPLKTGRSKQTTLTSGPYQCQWDDCTQLFSTLPELTEHLQYVHIPNESAFICLWRGCKRNGNPFMRYSCLMRHLRYHTGDKPCKCIFLGCGFSCVDNGDLRRHIKAVHQVDIITKKKLNT